MGRGRGSGEFSGFSFSWGEVGFFKLRECSGGGGGALEEGR